MEARQEGICCTCFGGVCNLVYIDCRWSDDLLEGHIIANVKIYQQPQLSSSLKPYIVMARVGKISWRWKCLSLLLNTCTMVYVLRFEALI